MATKTRTKKAKTVTIKDCLPGDYKLSLRTCNADITVGESIRLYGHELTREDAGFTVDARKECYSFFHAWNLEKALAEKAAFLEWAKGLSVEQKATLGELCARVRGCGWAETRIEADESVIPYLQDAIEDFGGNREWHGELYAQARFIYIEGEAWEKTYRIGDLAEHGSYNLSYYGTITAITETTVVITERHWKDETKRLKIGAFAYRNHDWDAGKAKKRNSEWMD